MPHEDGGIQFDEPTQNSCKPSDENRQMQEQEAFVGGAVNHTFLLFCDLIPDSD